MCHTLRDERDEARNALLGLNDAGSKGLLFMESCGLEQRYQLRCEFMSLEDLQAFHRALVECGRIAQALLTQEN